MQALTTNQVNEMLAEARRTAEEEMQVLIASAQKAVANAGGGQPEPAAPTE